MVPAKEYLRKNIWDLMESDGIAQSPCHGRIPGFHGSARAAELLRNTKEWNDAEIVFVSPDTALKMVRENALFDKKLLIMASPKLQKGYILIEPDHTEGREREASSIAGALKYGSKVEIFPTIDMVVEGSVAVDVNGGRLGKGGGYGDVEISYLQDMKVINPETPIVSIVHEIQVIKIVPMESHDQKINMIITPEMVLRI
jgi:5-formyltetrahydrofolate cyclo-ligase